jgi:phenylpyruvate tautomerase PptA (4-oxalocrotonate tautomerase family)
MAIVTNSEVFSAVQNAGASPTEVAIAEMHRPSAWSNAQPGSAPHAKQVECTKHSLQQESPVLSPDEHTAPLTAVVHELVASHHPHSGSSEHSPHEVFASQNAVHVVVDNVNPDDNTV